MTIRVLLADDQDLVRAGFRVLVDTAEDLEVVGEASDGAEALALLATRPVDVVLMDIRMPVLDGLAATRRIGADPALAGVRVLVLTTFEIDEYVVGALRAGASGFLAKNAKPDVLLDAIRTVAAGEALLSPVATRAVITRFLAQPVPDPAAAQTAGALTVREREVLAHVGLGASNDEIAATLVVSPLTVKTHISRILTKTGARDRAQLVVLAYESGLVRPGGQPSQDGGSA